MPKTSSLQLLLDMVRSRSYYIVYIVDLQSVEKVLYSVGKLVDVFTFQLWISVLNVCA